MLISEPFKKCKKFLSKTLRKYELFALLLMFIKFVLLITFLCAIFEIFPTGNLKSA